MPAVTVCAIPGWTKYSSNSGTEVDGVFKKKCENETTPEEFLSCMKNKTFSFKDLIVSARHGVPTENRKDLSDFNLWTWDMTFPAFWRCYTLDYDVPVGINREKDILAITVNQRHEYFVVFHETSLFALTTNKLAATTHFRLSQSTKFKWPTLLTLEAFKWKRLNRPEQT